MLAAGVAYLTLVVTSNQTERVGEGFADHFTGTLAAALTLDFALCIRRTGFEVAQLGGPVLQGRLKIGHCQRHLSKALITLEDVVVQTAFSPP